MNNIEIEKSFVNELIDIVETARDMSFRAANLMQVASNWLIGWRIVEQEQHGEKRAAYGKHIIEVASIAMTEKFGQGFSETTLRAYRKFYLEFPLLQIQRALPAEFNRKIEEIQQPLLAEFRLSDKGDDVNAQPLLPQLSWMHYERLMRVADKEARLWYMKESAREQWNYRTLRRNIDSQYYYRLLQTPANNRKEVEDEMKSLTASYETEKSTFVKNPMVVEFLGLSQNASYTESRLEQAILDHIQVFLMEMGKGYALVARQQHIHTEDDDYYIDLVFYNYLLKCFVLIDLKTTKVTYQDVGQMEMYLKLYDKFKRTEGDNSTIGIILCSETNADVAQYSSLATNKQMYEAKYLTYMPSKEELRREIERQKEIYRLHTGEDRED